MTDPEYRALPGVNFSTLKHFAVSPLAYRDALDAPRADTPAMLLGRAVHCAVLEPDTFAARYAVRPDGIDRRTKDGRAAWDAFLADAGGREVIDADTAALACCVRDAVRRHPAAARQLQEGAAEVVMQWRDADTGMGCKARADWIGPGLILDLKTASRLARHAWPSEVARRLYHAQLAFYRDGAHACGHGADLEPVIIAAETARPYDVGVFALDEDSIYCGQATYRDWLARLVHCVRDDHWPGQYPSEETLHLPAWAYGEDDEPAEVR